MKAMNYARSRKDSSNGSILRRHANGLVPLF